MMEANQELFARAQALVASHRHAEAERILRQLLLSTNVIDFEYDDWLRAVADCYKSLGRTREEGFVQLYLHQFERAALCFGDQPVELGRTREVEGRRAQGEPARRLFQQAADLYAKGGRHVLSAVAWSQASAHRDERRAWERVARDPRLRGRAYEEALVQFNLGLACRHDEDADASNRHLVQSQRLLEEVADDFEVHGMRERAFDCYCILLKLGLDSGSYENLAEGYINCIRVLKEDNLKFYVLQYYEDFLRISLEREEFHAAATVCREAADYSRRVGLIYDRGYCKRAAETWWSAAEKNERDGGPVEITENAFLAAVDAYNSIGDFYKVRDTYKRLCTLPLGEKKQRRYKDVVARYADVWQEAAEEAPFPDYLRQVHAYPDIWYQDLIEWELDGDHQEVCASIVGDVRYADQVRRRALSTLLASLEARQRAGGELDPTALAQVAQSLGELHAFAALRPLERLFESAVDDVRRGVMVACRRLYFKRTFQLVQRGLKDASSAVRDAAMESVAALHFPHAFDPLSRIFRESEDRRVKEVALHSLRKIGSLEAGEFLIDVLRYEVDPLRDLARRLLSQFENPDIIPIVKRYLETETGPSRALLDQVARSLQVRAPLLP